jgi:hypothetical protein
MPYIRQEERIRAAKLPETPGELNYAITMMVMDYLHANQYDLTYTNLNAVVGALECAKFELMRRVIGPFEDAKCKQNGDVY